MYEYVYDNNIIDLYIKHLYSKSLTDNLLTFLNLEEAYDTTSDEHNSKVEAYKVKR
jgi:hypothetical protein